MTAEEPGDHRPHEPRLRSDPGQLRPLQCVHSRRAVFVAQSPVLCHPAQLSLHLFGIQVQDYTSWVASVWQELQAEASSQEPGSGPLKLSAHKQLRAMLEAREELYQQAAQLGQQALLAAGTCIKEVGPPFPLPPLSLPEPSLHLIPVPLPHCATPVAPQRLPLGTHVCPMQAALWSAGCLCAHPQVRDGLQALRDQRERVFQAWEQKQERLQVMSREQLFLRKCGRLDEILKAREAGALAPEPP